MATKRFTGSDGNWGTAGNWTPSGVPVSGDDVILSGENDVAITSGVDQNTVNLNELFVGDGYTKDIGSNASPLIISATRVIHRGKGTFYLTNDGGSTTNVDELIVAFTGQSDTLAMQFVGVPFTLIVSRGRVTAELTDVSLTRTVVLAWTSSRENDAELSLTTSAFAIISRILIAGGQLTVNADITVGLFYVTGGVTDYKASLDIWALHMSDGVFNFEGVGSPPLITTANIYGGLLDLTTTARDKTITNTHLWPNGTLKYFPDLTTFTNPIHEFDGRSVAP